MHYFGGEFCHGGDFGLAQLLFSVTKLVSTPTLGLVLLPCNFSVLGYRPEALR